MFYGKNGPSAIAQKKKIDGKLSAEKPSKKEQVDGGTTPARNHAAAKKRHAKIKAGLAKAFPSYKNPPINQPYAKQSDGGNY